MDNKSSVLFEMAFVSCHKYLNPSYAFVPMHRLSCNNRMSFNWPVVRSGGCSRANTDLWLLKFVLPCKPPLTQKLLFGWLMVALFGQPAAAKTQSSSLECPPWRKSVSVVSFNSKRTSSVNFVASAEGLVLANR